MSRKRAAAGTMVPNDMDAKHASLKQDYFQLQHEFPELKNRMQAGKMRKATLYAEVRFLRQRLKKLKETRSDLKETETNSAIVPSNSSIARSGNSTSRAIVPEPSTQFPKNNLPRSTEIPVLPDLIKANGSDNFIMPTSVNESVGLVSALKTSAFRNGPNVFVAAMAGKRRISWQDHISLECN